ncbi:MAG TPA: hypothetical protein PK504_05245 [Ferruginibacter sp.]|nr:hypothetical protein [Ferruginibacter sp.]HRE62539.1 hypothetical protein [Ferruginibacter sp.]
MSKYLLLLNNFILILISNSYSQETEILSSYKSHINLLMKDGGKWISPNKNYDSTSENSALWFLYEYSSGLAATSLKLKVSEYIPKQAIWKTTQECEYNWDYKKQKPIWQSIGINGDKEIGITEKISQNEWVINTEIYLTDGSNKKIRTVQNFEKDEFGITSYVLMNGKWKKRNTVKWNKMNWPPGNISFMSTRDGNFEIYSMDLEGENIKNLSCNKATDFAFCHLQNNDLLFYSNRTGNNEIFIATADGKKTINLSNHASSDRVPYASPDGKNIMFVSDRDHQEGEVYMMNIDGSNVKRITHNNEFEDAPQWSPDGKKLIYTRQVKNANDTGNKAPLNGEIYIMNVDGSDEKQLTFRAGWDGGAAFSPNGNQIAFYGKTENGHYDIFLMDADGKNLFNLTLDEMEDYSPAWSPDSKWIAFTRGNAKNYDVWIMEIETKIKHRLTKHPKRDESPIWQN